MKKYSAPTWLALFYLTLLVSCSSKPKTEVGILNGMFYVNGKPTYEGRYWNGNKIEGLLINSRMVQGIFDDENPETRSLFKYPDTGEWDPDRNTNEFVAAMPLWKSYGLNSFTLNLQGGSPTGYGNRGWINSAFDTCGVLKPQYMERLARILDKADELEMVVILGYFYPGQVTEAYHNEELIIRIVDNVTQWLLEKGYKNVLVEIGNECDYFKVPILHSDGVHQLIERVQSHQKDGYRLLTSVSYAGGKLPTAEVVRIADFILLHGNGQNPRSIKTMVDSVRQMNGYRGQPVVFNEDDHYDFDKAENNFKSAIERYASWGYFDFRRTGKRAMKMGVADETDLAIGFQSVPVDWGLHHERKLGFFNYVKEITGYQLR